MRNLPRHTEKTHQKEWFGGSPGEIAQRCAPASKNDASLAMPVVRPERGIKGGFGPLGDKNWEFGTVGVLIPISGGKKVETDHVILAAS